MADVTMPRLSDSMEEGTILKWLKSDGDQVEAGEELLEIETDKANMTYEAESGGMLEIVAKEGDTLPVGEVIARLGEGKGGGEQEDGPEEEDGEQQDDSKQEDESEPSAESGENEDGAEADDESSGDDAEADDEDSGGDEDEAEPDGGGEVEAGGDEEAATPENGRADEDVKASPVARRMAREMGIEISSVQGSGPGGRVTKSDVEALQETATEAKGEEPEAAPPPAPVSSGRDVGTAKGSVEVQGLSKLQQTVARRMAESKATAPEFVISVEVDMEEAVALRSQLKAITPEGEPVPSFNDFVVKASGLALREFPRANGAYRDGRFELYARVNVGVAVAAQDALVVPTIFDADRKSLSEIARDARALAERVRKGVVTPPELSGGTFTVSNLGMYGIKRFVAVINPPQAAILAVGAMEQRAVVVDGEFKIRQRMDLTLSCDHRILYGADAAQFLGRIRENLEAPLRLAL